MTTLYFLGTRLLASSDAAPWWSDDQPLAGSIAYTCPTCGDTWGRVAFLSGWLPVRAGCPKHPWPHADQPGGSFIAPWRQGCPAELPPEILRYELSIRLKALDAQQIGA